MGLLLQFASRSRPTGDTVSEGAAPRGGLLRQEPSPQPPPLVLRWRKANVHPELFDTSALQLACPPGSLSQVASNFNCLELSSAIADPFSGRFLTKLMSDSTQGPSAAAGAGLGAIGIVAHSKQQPIDLLRSVSGLSAVSGKLYFSKDEGDSEDFDENQVRVGLLQSVQATFDRSVPGRCTFVPDGPVIDQVFVSTVILPRQPSDEELQTSRKLLKAAYDATYLAAVLGQSPRLLLTLVGGGSFRNRLEDIVGALVSAHQQFAGFLREGCEVLLAVFEPRQGLLVEKLLLDCRLAADQLGVEAVG